MLQRYLVIFFAALLGVQAYAQLTDKLFAIRNPAPSVFWFCSIDVADGVVTDLEQAPIASLWSGLGSCVDVDEGVYYLCADEIIFGLDANGLLPMTTTVLPLPPGGHFTQVVFDPCERVFYGALTIANDSAWIARYDPMANTFTELLALQAPLALTTGLDAEFDAPGGTYIIPAGVEGGESGLICFDVHTETLLSVQDVLPIPDELFGHWALSCGAVGGPLLFGTSIDLEEEEKQLGVCDPFNPEVFPVGNTITTDGFWKPSWGGACIDQDNAIFYWSGLGGRIMGVSLSSGEIVCNQSIPGGEFNLIEHFSGCLCSVSTSSSTALAPGEKPDLVILGDGLVMTGDHAAALLTLCDAQGRLLLNARPVRVGELFSMKGVGAGLYIARLSDPASGRLLASRDFTLTDR